MKVYSAKFVIKFLEQRGFVFVRQRGSHMRFEKLINNRTLKVTVPNHKELMPGTLRSILEQAQIAFADFRTRI